MGYLDEMDRRVGARRRAENRAKRKILLEVGRAIVALSNIENRVSTIYHDYCDTSTTLCMPIFFEQNDIKKRVKLTNLIVEMCAEKQHKERWKKIIGGLEGPRAVRNFVAHCGVSVNTLRTDVPVAYLHPPWLKIGKDGNRTGRVVALSEVKAAADALEHIGDELEAFWNDLQEYWYPEPKDEED
jgi:hypothetical protein